MKNVALLIVVLGRALTIAAAQLEISKSLEARELDAARGDDDDDDSPTTSTTATAELAVTK